MQTEYESRLPKNQLRQNTTITEWLLAIYHIRKNIPEDDFLATGLDALARTMRENAQLYAIFRTYKNIYLPLNERCRDKRIRINITHRRFSQIGFFSRRFNHIRVAA